MLTSISSHSKSFFNALILLYSTAKWIALHSDFPYNKNKNNKKDDNPTIKTVAIKKVCNKKNS